jgi:hypothetical protein
VAGRVEKKGAGMSVVGMRIAALIQQLRATCSANQPAPWSPPLEPALLVPTETMDPLVFRFGDSRGSMGKNGCRFVMLHPGTIQVVRTELQKAMGDLIQRGWPVQWVMARMESRAVVDDTDLARIILWMQDDMLKRREAQRQLVKPVVMDFDRKAIEQKGGR